MPDLWQHNTPEKFWICQPGLLPAIWNSALKQALPVLGLPEGSVARDIPALTLGEGRFGPDHWRLNLKRRIYYLLKPFIPRPLTRLLRRNIAKKSLVQAVGKNWPIDERYVRFQWEIVRHLLMISGNQTINYKNFWPNDFRFAFTLTHDIETAEGQAFVRKVADLEENFGFRSSFNFVLERYALDFELISDLKMRGFEVGCHGVKHDGKLYSSQAEFSKRAAKINLKMKEYGMVGFRSPLTHRNPEWMQILEIEYDSSFFDTDPFEPIPGGSMSIWPYFLGRFIELPYTLVQDHTLTTILGETTPSIWLDKVEFIKKYHGMALLNSHPDYLKDPITFNVYAQFLETMKKNGEYWHALPRDVARWWKFRAGMAEDKEQFEMGYSTASLEGDEIIV